MWKSDIENQKQSLDFIFIEINCEQIIDFRLQIQCKRQIFKVKQLILPTFASPFLNQNMKCNLENQHINPFCSSAHPIIEKIVKDYYNRGSIDTNAIGDLIDELEILENMLDDKCQCRKAMAIIVEAANLQKWLRILFAQHQSKFRKHSIRIPDQYEQMKSQLNQLIGNLQQKMLFSTYQNFAKSEKKKIFKKRRRQWKNKNTYQQKNYKTCKKRDQELNQEISKMQSNPEMYEYQ